MIRVITTALLLLWQPPEPVTFEAQANLVPIEADVRNSLTLLPILGLTRDDFIVFDESKEASIRVFDSTPLPLNLVLLVDVSGGSTNEGVLFTTDALISLLKPDDRIALVSFGAGRAQLRTGLTNDASQIRAARNQIFEKDRNPQNGSADHTSRLLDAISHAIEVFPKPNNVRRPALVVITHNRDAHSAMKKEAVLQSLLSSGVMLNAITIPQQLPVRQTVVLHSAIIGQTSRPTPQAPPPPEFAENLHSSDGIIETAGGIMIPLDYVNAHRASSPNTTGRTWDSAVIAKDLDFDLISRLRSRYTLGIYSEPIAKPEFHRIHVRLSDAAQTKYPHAAVNTRAGYYTNGH